MQEKLLYALNAFTSMLYSKFRGNVRDIDPEKVKSIVCVKWDEIGDMVTALHVFDLLKLRFPSSQITVVCKPFVGSLLLNNPNIDRVVNHTDGIKDVDVWIELRGTFQTWFKSLFSGAKYRMERGSVRFIQRGNQPHEKLTNFNIIKPLLGSEIHLNSVRSKLHLTLDEKQEIEKVFLNLGLKSSESFCMIHPGGRSLLRRWPADRFQKTIEFLEQRGNRCVVFGTSDEIKLLEEFNLLNSNTIIWETTESLRVFYGVLQKAELFVGNESGPLQLADFAGVASIGLFGPGVENVFYPQGAKTKVLHKILPCNPCDQVHCSRFNSRCMLHISTDEVESAIIELIK